MQGSDLVRSNAISSLPLGATTDAGAPTFLAGDQPAAGFAVGASDVYWTTTSKCRQTDAGLACNDNVESVAIGGGAPVTLASQQVLVGPIVVDAARAYVSGAAGLLAVPLDGGAVATLAAGAEVDALVQDDASVYWTNLTSGQVMRLTKP